jgi:hypothetical protein
MMVVVVVFALYRGRRYGTDAKGEDYFGVNESSI